MLWAFHSGLTHGVHKTLWTLAGLSLGLFLLLAVSLAGIGYLSQTLPTVFEALKLLGAAYLAWLGLQLWRNTPARFGQHGGDTHQTTVWQLFRTGITVSLSNPKAILFFAAFFPKFLDTAQPLLPQYTILTLTFFAIETTWQLIYTIGGRTLAGWLARGQRLRALNRLCGIVFILIAASLAADTLCRGG